MSQESLPFIPRRLEKFLRDATELSVDDGRRANEHGRVAVVSPVATGPSHLRFDDLIFGDDVVLLDGRRVAPRQEQTTLMLNKPKKVTATLRDPLGQRDLTSYIEAMPAGVFPVGRLDRDTTGLLLFTSDGDLANAILHPEHETRKVYWLWLDEHVSDHDPRLAQLLEGVAVHGYVARAVNVAVHHRTECCTELLVTLHEGKNRQIRKMCRALDFYLRHLHRRSIGTLSVDPLPVGQWRHLTQSEVEALWKATGGHQRARDRKLSALARRARERRGRGTPDLRLEAWLARFGPTVDTR